MVELKQRRGGQSRANPILQSRRRKRNRRNLSVETLIVSFLGVVVVVMCSAYVFHFKGLIHHKATPPLLPTVGHEKKSPGNNKKRSKKNAASLGKHQKKNQKKAGRNNQDIPQKPPAPLDGEDKKNLRAGDAQDNTQKVVVTSGEEESLRNQLPHLVPKLPILPIFPEIPNSMRLMDETLQGKPTMSGIVVLLQNFFSEFHKLNIQLSSEKTTPVKILRNFFKLAEKHLIPFDAVYRGNTIFPIREDDSIFLSLASFREHLLKETLVEAFGNAKSPDHLYVGAVVQNCFGQVDEDGKIHTEGNPCRSGFVVVGKNAQGRDQVKVSDVPPDKNGIEEFCSLPDYKKYCDSGQVRAVYVHEPESIGPAMARYFASKLWGGETYFVQTDSHLQFAESWDAKYIDEVKATKNYPKSVLSSYPPGFSGDGSKHQKVNESKGARLCSCSFSESPIEQDIIRINTGNSYSGGETRPTQIPFIAAGFFFARAEFLRDVPFDPFLPWCFMGEEIALSLRAWTSGWNIYAPRKNLIIHQYRPGRMGLPKFWEGVNRLYRGSGADNNSLQGRAVQRVKYMVGYPETTAEILKDKNEFFILTEQEHYGVGTERTLEEYMNWTGIDVNAKKCARIKWCSNGELE